LALFLYFRHLFLLTSLANVVDILRSIF